MYKFEKIIEAGGQYSCLEITDEGINIITGSKKAFYPYGSFTNVNMEFGIFSVEPRKFISYKDAPLSYAPANAEEGKKVRDLISYIKVLNERAKETDSIVITEVDSREDKDRILTSSNDGNTNQSFASKRLTAGDVIKLLVFIIILVLIIVGLFQCAGGSADSNIGYDEEGFLNMSDGFWEWMMKQ